MEDSRVLNLDSWLVRDIFEEESQSQSPEITWLVHSIGNALLERFLRRESESESWNIMTHPFPKKKRMGERETEKGFCCLKGVEEREEDGQVRWRCLTDRQRRIARDTQEGALQRQRRRQRRAKGGQSQSQKPNLITTSMRQKQRLRGYTDRISWPQKRHGPDWKRQKTHSSSYFSLSLSILFTEHRWILCKVWWESMQLKIPNSSKSPWDIEMPTTWRNHSCLDPPSAPSFSYLC